jgi:hypothetical protein
MDALPIILAALVLLGMIGFVLFLNWADRGRVTRLIESHGGRVESLSRREGPIWVRMLLQQSVTHWDVVYRDNVGQRRKALCTAMFLRCFIEKDEAA